MAEADEHSRRIAKGSEPRRGRRESPDERADRNMGELLQELRVALPGVQVLFAFLLTVPFAQGFTRLNSGQQDLYFGILMATAISTAFLIAPSALHRLLFRKHEKEYLVRISNRLTIAGLGLLGLAIIGAVLLIADVLFDGARVVVFTGVVAGFFVVLWVALPLLRRRTLRRAER